MGAHRTDRVIHRGGTRCPSVAAGRSWPRAFQRVPTTGGTRYGAHRATSFQTNEWFGRPPAGVAAPGLHGGRICLQLVLDMYLTLGKAPGACTANWSDSNVSQGRAPAVYQVGNESRRATV